MSSAPEYLDSHGGRPLRPGGRLRRPGRRTALLAGGVVGLTAVAVGGAWAWSFLSTGAQPAEALPGSTIAYASIDLDPSGGQKIEALRTLRKFPAFEDHVGLNTDDDVRRYVFELAQDDGACPDLDYGRDVAPWLGDRMAVAAVDTGGGTPAPVFVVQVTDEAAAEDGLAALAACAGDDSAGGDSEGAWTVSDGWALVGESQKVVDGIAADARTAPLSQDDDYTTWTAKAGDPGIASFYLAPEAGKVLAGELEKYDGLAGGSGSASGSATASASPVPVPSASPMPSEMSGEMPGEMPGEMSSAAPAPGEAPGALPAAGGDDTIRECPAPCMGTAWVGPGFLPPDAVAALKDFGGLAGTLRFSDGGVELEVAADPGSQNAFAGSDGGGDLVSTLPEDTAVALGMGFEKGWFSDLVDRFASTSGMSSDQLLEELSKESGLDLPQDAETLAGDSAALAVGSDFDPRTFFASTDSPDVPVGVKVRGDAEGIESVLAKLRPQTGADADVLGSDHEGGTVAIGPDAGYRAQLLKDGGLGDSDVFRHVVPEAGDATAVMFVNFDAGDWLATLVDEDAEAARNVKPLEAFGASAWRDGDTSRLRLRLTTD